jgi:hypothetical protein
MKPFLELPRSPSTVAQFFVVSPQCMLSLFKRRPNPDVLAKDLSELLAQVSVHELLQLSELWRQPLDDEARVLFFLEYSFFLIAVADRLAHKKFGDPLRREILNSTVNRIRDLFCR